MAITIKGSSSSSTNTIAVPASGIAAGDLCILLTGNYGNGALAAPAAWTQFGSTVSASATYTHYAACYYYKATSALTGNITMTNGSGYQGAVLLVITGHDNAAPMHAFSSNSGNSTVMSTNSITTTAKSRIIYFWTEMANTQSPIPTFTFAGGPASTLIQSVSNTNGYNRTEAWLNNANPLAPTTNYGAATMNTNSQGAFIGLGVAVKEGNVAPSVTAMAPNMIAADNRYPTTFTYTASNAEGDAHNAAEIRYRVRGSTDAYTTVTANSTTSHTFAANTFTLGTEYEWAVRVSDVVAGYGDWSQTGWFMAGADVWRYSAEVPTASTTNQNPLTPFFTHTFESGIEGWGTNSFFGTYTDPVSYTNTTTRARTGTRSLEVTWPTASASRVISTTNYTGFVVGGWYEFRASIYVPAGSPNVIVDPFFQQIWGQTAAHTVTTKDQWVDQISYFQATQTEGIQFSVITASAPTSGQKVFIDDVSVRPMVPPEGNYIVQVRTADAQGFGPWSSSATFTQKAESKLWVKSGGTWKKPDANAKVGGTFKSNGVTVLPPRTIPNLDMWLNADSIQVADGATVSSWGDTVNGRSATPGTFNAPTLKKNAINGHNVVSFTAGGAQALRVPITSVTNYSLFVVARYAGAAQGRVLAGDDSAGTNYLLGWHGGRTGVFYANGWVNYDDHEGGKQVFRMFSAIRGATDHFFYKNGKLHTQNLNGGANPGGKLYLNGFYENAVSGTSEFSDCEIAEVIYYTRALNDVETSKVHNYLADKYGLQKYDVEVQADNPMGFWKLAEHGGTKAFDYSGNERHGTWVNGPTFRQVGPTQRNEGTFFTRASNTRVDLPAAGFPSGTGPYTLEAWINVPYVDALQGIISNGRYDTNNQSNAIRLDGTQAAYNYAWGNDAYFSSALITPNQWLHIVATYDGSNRRMYVNGTLIGTVASGSINSQPTVPTIGKTYSNEYFNGRISNVAVYNTALSEARIKAHHYAMQP